MNQPPSSSLAQRLRRHEPLLGPLLRMPNEALIELTGLVGMDFVVIDTEHGPADQIPLSHHLMAAAGAGIPALVRIGQLSEILRVLDLGAAGIIAPHISTVAEAEAVVRAASYPPRGTRGFATYTRRGRHGLLPAAEHLREAADGTAIIVMIEDRAGVDAAEQIAAVDGVDGVFVGPADLSVALGFPGDPGHPVVRSAIAEVHAAARRSGVAVVTITGEPAVAREHFQAGGNMVIYNALAALGGLFTSMASARDPLGATRDPAGATAAVHDPLVDRAGPSVAEPVVLLAGMLSTPQLWDGVVDDLDPTLQARAVRLDLDDSVSGMAESVLAQAPERFALVGHSLGGVVALDVVRRAPQRVSALVLLNCSARGPSAAQSQDWDALAERTRDGQFTDVVTEQARLNLGPAASRSDLVTAWQQGARRVGAAGFLRQLSAQHSRSDNRSALSAITVPTLVLSGELDTVAPSALQRELADGVRGATHVVIAGSGHASPLDAAPELARLINDFLLRRSDSPGSLSTVPGLPGH